GKIDNLQVYPNPVNNVVNIAGVAPNSVIKIFDMAGNQVNRKFTLSAMNSFDLSACKEGIYLIVVSDGSGNTETFKILKNKVP
ncbi:MAG TPA: T9SS type A sorting domain-containing protein, partial [Saprospiraceae bacterium]|nr:T9SS type A sorting domain-containing protein [Saprospiraceae bacterium]